MLNAIKWFGGILALCSALFLVGQWVLPDYSIRKVVLTSKVLHAGDFLSWTTTRVKFRTCDTEIIDRYISERNDKEEAPAWHMTTLGNHHPASLPSIGVGIKLPPEFGPGDYQLYSIITTVCGARIEQAPWSEKLMFTIVP